MNPVILEDDMSLSAPLQVDPSEKSIQSREIKKLKLLLLLRTPIIETKKQSRRR
jgi:hypothetical protein